MKSIFDIFLIFWDIYIRDWTYLFNTTLKDKKQNKCLYFYIFSILNISFNPAVSKIKQIPT